MKKYLAIPISFALSMFIAGISSATEYPGGGVVVPGFSFGTSLIVVPDIGAVQDVNIKLSACVNNPSLSGTAMYVVSPSGTIIALYEKYDLAEQCLYGTYFDDSANKSILRSIAPYIGPHRPKEELATFNGEWTAGTWTIVLYNDVTADFTLYYWSLFLNEPPPPTPTPTPADLQCVYYAGDPVSWTGVTSIPLEIYMPDQGTVDDVDVHMSAQVSGDLQFTAMYLISPAGTQRPLYEKGDIEEHELYLTVFDDEAGIPIEQGIAPYIGPHQPRGTLSSFDGQWATGRWKLVVYNDSSGNDGRISDWGIRYCIRGSLGPTRTPTPPYVPSPTLSPTLPPGIGTPTPEPSASPSPSPSPSPTPELECVDYLGDWVSWSTIAVKTSSIHISSPDAVGDVKVRITAQVATDLRYLGMFLYSPSGTIVSLFEKYDLTEHQLYQTWFDDSAWTAVTNGIAPYFGSFQPVEPLRAFQGEWMAGTWTLILYNDFDANGGQIDDWILKMCGAAAPTPTPSCSPPPVTPSPAPVGNLMAVLGSGDYNGDGTSDIGFFRPSSALWSIRNVGTDIFGAAGDVPASGDYDGDGTAELAFYRSAQGLYYVRGFSRMNFGVAGDRSVPADYDGDGFCDPAIFRAATGFWYAPDLTRAYFGRPGDLPVPGDYDDDGIDEIAIFRPSTKLWAIRGLSRAYFGSGTDYAVVGRYGGGPTLICIFRPAGGLWVIRDLSRFSLGQSGDFPVQADYRGDGTDRVGIFRPASGLWSVKDLTRAYWGAAGDIPVTR